VTHHPISVDPAEFDELSASVPVLAAEQALVAERPEKLIVRVDRTDPAKNIVRGFRAYRMLLDEQPQWHGRVTMLALLDPSRQSVPEYVDYLAAVEREAREINERFGRPDWLPIDLDVADDFPRSVAAYKQFDVLFVNAVYDGLNLVAKEAPLVNVRNGALILSENAGAHEELGDWAITVNPFDLVGQAAALHEALTMDEDERARRSAAIGSQVREHDLAAWLAALLADVEHVSRNVRP
jgi:trehalose 6-phosphate synthase